MRILIAQILAGQNLTKAILTKKKREKAGAIGGVIKLEERQLTSGRPWVTRWRVPTVYLQ